MMMRHIFLVIIILALTYEKLSIPNEIGGSQNFYMSGGKSKEIYERMIQDGIDKDTRKKFVQLEDRLFQVERNAFCSKIPQYIEATALSTMIKDMFPKYDFSYHTIHIKQAAEPTKIVNTLITC